MIVDTSALIAYFDADEPDQARVAAVLESTEESLVVSPYVIAEVDYLLSSRLGPDYAVAALRQLASGAWELAEIGVKELQDIADFAERYSDFPIGAADASNAVLAERYGTDKIATLDHRLFRAIKTPAGRPLGVLP
ncbi:PIN domain-containing protein [Nesterenkonia muleiensis]|uniref:PIN domain-containing protein n=1 Tax=Nesterenkonia muleiensis TaxID=2282648 RepID=UPI000E76F6DA|nr:PIN domain-containing protein [Nesterenkonia muleiensis]